MTQGFVRPELLTETGWLAQHLQDPGVRVLDCTTHLPPLPDNSFYTVRPARDDFLKGHIPGSAFVDMDRDVADNSAPLHFTLPSSIQFAEANALRPEQQAGTGGVYYGRRGHISGSVNLAAMATVDEENVYNGAEELRRMFAEPLSERTVITYCGAAASRHRPTRWY